MRNLLKQFKKGSREVRLTVEEKSAMRQALLKFARENPVVHTSRAKNSRTVVSPYSFMRKARGFKVLSATVIGGILIGGTVSFAAEGSLPGNVLYPVKTEVNERVRGVMAVTPHAKAGWDIRLVERRLSEMKEVGLIETVPLETKEAARKNVKKYTERAQKRIVELDDNDDEEALVIAENLARILQSHESMLLDDIHKRNNDITEERLSDEGDFEIKEIKIETKEPSKLKKEVKRIRAMLPVSTHVSNTLATSTLPITVKDISISRENEKRQNEDTDRARFKKNSIESLEKTVDDIRSVRESLEKRNREKKAEYEHREDSRKEEEKNDERKTYISTPSSESER